jgi:hypothetical protein
MIRLAALPEPRLDGCRSTGVHSPSARTHVRFSVCEAHHGDEAIRRGDQSRT